MFDLTTCVDVSTMSHSLAIRDLQDKCVRTTEETVLETVQFIMSSDFIQTEHGVQTITDALYTTAYARKRELKTLAKIIYQLDKNKLPNNMLHLLIPKLLDLEPNFMEENWHMALLFECYVDQVISEEIIGNAIQKFGDIYPAKGFEMWVILTWFAPIMERYNQTLFADHSQRIDKYYHDGPNQFQYFLDIYAECKKDNWWKFKDIVGMRCLPGDLRNIIYTDDIDAFQSIAKISGFDYDMIIDHSQYEDCHFLWYHPHIIQYAAFHGAIEIFKFCLSHGASPILYDDALNHLMQFSVAGGNLEIIKICEKIDNNYVGTAEAAVDHFNTDILYWLMSTKNVQITQSVFTASVKANNVQAMLMCLENISISINPNTIDKEGMTPLHYAALLGCINAIEILLGHKNINYNPIDKNKMTPFLLAVQHGRIRSVKTLLNYKEIDLLAINSESKNALHFAIEEGHLEIAKILLALKVYDINAKNIDGMTALHLTVREKLGDVIFELLKEEDIDMNSINNEGDTPLYTAIRYSQVSIAKVLTNDQRTNVNAYAGAQITPLILSINSKLIDIVSMLLSHSELDVNQKDEDENTPLHSAVMQKNLEVMEMLLSHSQIDINARDSFGMTPLHVACSDDFSEGVELLLKSPKINPNILDSSGMLPIHVAILVEQSNCLSHLLNHPSIDLGIQDSDGNTPLDLLKQDPENFLNIKNNYHCISKLI